MFENFCMLYQLKCIKTEIKEDIIRCDSDLFCFNTELIAEV